MKVLVTGCRDWDSDEEILIVLRELEKLPAGTIVIHGAAPGVDTIAWAIADLLGFTVRAYPARWDELGHWAGSVRNQTMLDLEHTWNEPIDFVLAFHHNISESRGTKNMIERATAASLPHKLFPVAA